MGTKARITWNVRLTKSVERSIKTLPKDVRSNLVTLFRDIEFHGPVSGNCPNYSKLSETQHHCHIKKGKPTYVALWEVVNKQVKIIEVTYAGTHEKAPY